MTKAKAKRASNSTKGEKSKRKREPQSDSSDDDLEDWDVVVEKSGTKKKTRTSDVVELND